MNQVLFETKRVIRMYDTDATGVIYFNQIFRMACDTFEEALETKGFDLKTAIESSDFMFPIVAASSEYFAPLRLSEKVKIVLNVKKVSEKSFILCSKFYIQRDKVLASQVLITHACVSKASGKSCPIPDHLKNVFM